MSGFNSVDDFYDVMAGCHGLHESERGGGTLELYSFNGTEFPDGLDGSSLDVITAPSPEFLAYMRGNDSPVPPSGYKDTAEDADLYEELRDAWDGIDYAGLPSFDGEVSDVMLGGADRDAVFEAWRDDADPVLSDMYFDVEKLPCYIETAKGGKRNA